MIKRLSHATVYVLDQDRAIEFYTKKLGLEVRTDATMGDFRWVTVGVPGQPELEIALMEPEPGMIFNDETAAQLRSLVEKGVLGGGAFDTDDCAATYEELKARGVPFHGAPQKESWGLSAVFTDDSGNFFSLSQP
ncbi:MAG TPA: VOC family protein [Thermoanaerobaculia bacterium]|nr:VOC family protein [Thermoanaerobaculia bacterium]